jgi:hypothetical protein
MNPSALPFVAALVVELPKRNRGIGKVPGLILSDVLVIAGVGLGLLVLLGTGIYFWMKLRRKRRRHISGGEKVYRDSHHLENGEEEQPEEVPATEEDEDDSEESEESQHHHHHHRHHDKRRYKYRVRRRTHRSRNPTLSETGGLPPVKTHEPGTPG